MTILGPVIFIGAIAGLVWLVDQWILLPRRVLAGPDQGQGAMAEYAGYAFLAACVLLFVKLQGSPYAAVVELYPIVVFTAVLSSVVLVLDVALFAPERARLGAAKPDARPVADPPVVHYAQILCPASIWMLVLHALGGEDPLPWALYSILAFGIVSLYDDWLVNPRRQLTGKPKPRVLRIIDALLLGSALSAVWGLFSTEAVDFSLVLAILAALSGLIWLLDRLLMRRARAALAPAAEPLPEPLWVEYARTFFPIIVIVLAVRSFVFEPFRIPSDSMMPTLQAGDFIFVNKYAYGLRLPVINSKVTEGVQPKRGDVIVFRLPSNPRVNYIKRLVGLPGDHILVRDNQLYVNGTPQPQQAAGVYAGPKDCSREGDCHEEYRNAPVAIERLGEISHPVMFADQPSKDFDQVVPAGYYFFMGDNRNNSLDSRFPGAVGFVPEQNLVGRAVRVWLNFKYLKRIGEAIH